MNSKTARTPTWNVWLNLPEVEIWEAVALSLNIDPKRVKHSPHSWLAGESLFDEADDFEDRFTVATRSAGTTLVLSTVSPVNRAESKVSLPGFSRWAGSLHWQMPDEMSVLADVAAIESKENASGDKALPQRADSTYLSIIGGLLGLMLGKTPAGKPQSAYKDQAAIISALLAHYRGQPGISKRNLEKKFAEAKRSLSPN